MNSYLLAMLSGVVGIFLAVGLGGCSINKMAAGSVADALGNGSGTVFTGESDVELVREALPFGLKTMESLLEEVPGHKGLCLSLAQGYVLYTYAQVELKAEELKDENFAEYQYQRTRASRLYYRAYLYGLKGLSLCCKTFGEEYKKDRALALSRITAPRDAGLLYWTGAALAKWITVSKGNPSALIRLPQAAEFMQRALLLDSSFDGGAIQEFFITYESRGAALGGDSAKALKYYEEALRLSNGKRTSVLLAYAEAFLIPSQDQGGFDSLMQAILAFDIDSYPPYRLSNALTRQKAASLLKREDDLFIGE